MRSVIIDCLNMTLPDSYDRVLFENKSNVVYKHIVEQAIMEAAWVLKEVNIKYYNRRAVFLFRFLNKFVIYS